MTRTFTDVAPAEPFGTAKRRIAEIVEQHRAEILELSHRIHANPEPAFEEHQAAQWVAEAVARHGYVVEHPAGTLPTAVRGRLAGGQGQDGPRIGILAEYDALPGLGHGCGHNTMAASGVGAAIALAAIAPELSGEIVFLGTPAEERGSGKQFMLDDGLFEGVDAALLFHPMDRAETETLLLASIDVEVSFEGRQAHAAGNPWEGLNALDALVLLFQGVGLWRQQLKPDARVHGIVLEGGTAANIIPSVARARFMLRSFDQAYYEQMQARFARMVEGAALMTGTRGSVEFSGGSSTMRHNRVLGDRWELNARAYGVEPRRPVPEFAGSSDMGNVSQVLPTIHPTLPICPEDTPGHSIEFRDAAVSEAGDEATILAATLVAQTAYDLFADPSLVAAAWREFRT